IQNWIVSDYKFLEEHNQNPFWMLNRIPANTKRHRFSTSGSVKYRITDYLNIQGRLSYERDNLISRKEKYATTYRTSMGAYNQTTSFYEHLYGDALLNFNKVVSDFSITATAGAGFTKEQSTGTYHNAEGDQFYWIDTTDKNGNPYRVPQGNTYFMNVFHRDNYYDVYLKETFSEKRLNSVFGTFQLGYKELAYVDFTARNDWSSTLAFTKNKSMSFFYPSVGVTILLNDIFNMNKDLFNLVKVRGSYSVVGNDLPAYLSRPVPMVNGTSVTLPSLMPFTDLKSEKTYSVEAGFDLSLFESRLNIDFTFYKANTKNQYFQVDAPASSGYAKRNINAGNIQNMGVETSVNYHFSFNNEWSWTPGINFSYNDNKIVEICPGTDEYILASSDAVVMKLKKNGSYGDMYTHQLLRDEKGNILLDDNGTPMKTPDFDHYSGNFNSKIRLGWSNTINWKDLSIYALIDGKIGGKVMSMTEAIMDGYGVSENSGNARDKGGIANTDGSLIDAQKYYSTVGGRAQNASFVAEEYMYDATNFRLRELSVGYTFRNLFGIGKNLTTSIVGRNLFFFYKDSPCDPDISGSTGNGWQGIDVFSLPSTRTFGLNLKLTF
ncbi:MAG: TonB-dependent receptor, partial [Bacteroidaceae bacterium]